MGFRNRSHAPPKMNIYAVLGGYSLPSPTGRGWGVYLVAGGRGTEATVLLLKHICIICSICVRLKYSTIIIRVKNYLFVLQQEVRVFTPLSNGEGLGEGLLNTKNGNYTPLYILRLCNCRFKNLDIIRCGLSYLATRFHVFRCGGNREGAIKVDS